MTELRIRPGGSFTGVAGRTVAIQFLRAAMEAAQLRRLDIREALRDADITEDIIGQDATRVTSAQATRLVQALWTATDDELLGVGPQSVPRGTFRMMALGLIHTPICGPPRSGLSIHPNCSGIRGCRDDRGRPDRAAIVRSAGSRRTDPLLIDMILAVVHRFASWLIGRRITLCSSTFPA